MSSHTNFIRNQLNGDTIRLTADAVAEAVAVTETQFIIGHAGLFGRWGGKLQRYELNQLTGLDTVTDPRINMLRLDFAGSPARSVRVLYENEARPDFERVVALLKERLASNAATGGK